ncbi:hypothetical protein [Streptomyces scopuliridis]|uniref:hypothetical protein n=1 Tax=Streptomyces scopuliridis TaxID=452529 RepID=UPI00341AA296
MRATIMTRPVPAVTTPTEPRPRGDRPVGIPPTPTHTGQLATLLGTARTVRAGVGEEIEQAEDASGRDGNGYEEEPESHVRLMAAGLPTAPKPLLARESGKVLSPDQRLGLYLHRLSRTMDAAIPAERRAPRTLPEMRARINIAAGVACGACGGRGGEVVDTSSGGVTRKTWQSCGTCKGTGTA